MPPCSKMLHRMQSLRRVECNHCIKGVTKCVSSGWLAWSMPTMHLARVSSYKSADSLVRCKDDVNMQELAFQIFARPKGLRDRATRFGLNTFGA